MLGYTHRNKETDYGDIWWEFYHGGKPENSLIYGTDHPMNKDLLESYSIYKAFSEFMQTNEKEKHKYTPGFGLFGLLRPGGNMTEQMVGKASVSIYPLGDLRVVLATDAKSITSLTPWPDPEVMNIDREQNMGSLYHYLFGQRFTNTRQTYLFILSKEQLHDTVEKFETRNEPFD